MIAKADGAAFATLFNRYRSRVYSIALKLSHSTVIAEEIIQEVFLKVWLKRAGLTDIHNFSAYLFVITRNEVYLALNRIAQKHRTVLLIDKEHAVSDNDNERRFMEREYDSLLQKAIERLPVQQKKVYKLMKVQGLRREEVANLLHVHPETVKSHLAKAMKNVHSFCAMHL